MTNSFKNRSYWKRYPVDTNPDEIEQSLAIEVFHSGGRKYELLEFYKDAFAPNVLISQGSGGHAYVFAELGYLIHKLGFNVFIMPKNGGYTITELLNRHMDAVRHITSHYSGNLHLYGEGLGGLVIFYLALADRKNMKSIICENAPAILTDKAFHKAMKADGAAGKRRTVLLPLFKALVKVFPFLPIPIKAYLGWNEMIDFEVQQNRAREEQLVHAYNQDPDFDDHYPLRAVMSLVTTQPPQPLSSLSTPTMFMLAKRGIVPSYLKELFDQLPVKTKRLEEIDGGVFWMLSNPAEAAKVVVNWINGLHRKQTQSDQSDVIRKV